MKYLILLSGKLNSGKNQYARYLTDHFESKGLTVKADLYAKDLKDFSVQDFSTLGVVLSHKVDKIKAEIGAFFDSHEKASVAQQDAINKSLEDFTFGPANFYEDKTDITRTLLQVYGTDIARTRFDNHFWIKKLAERINGDTDTDVIIITDVRFPNELEDIHDYVTSRRIIPIRMERDIERNSVNKEHVSETALDDYEFFEYIIDNNGTLEALKESSDIVTDDIMTIE